MGEETLSHYQLAITKQKQKEVQSNKYKDKSKKRLSNIVTTKMKTSFIGAISACENNIGFLWGHGRDEDSLTEEELAMKEIWESVRSKILDNGNAQLRACINEINQYTIDWNRYQINIPMDLNQDKEN